MAAFLGGLALLAAGCGGQANVEGERGDVEQALRAYFDAIMLQSVRAFDTVTTEDFVLVQNGHHIDRERYTETWVEGQPLQTRYRQENPTVDIDRSTAIAELELGWYENRALVQREAVVGLLRRDGGAWKLFRLHSATMPLGLAASGGTLDDYVGSYAVQDYRVDIELRGDRLVSSRPGRLKWVGGLAEAELEPGGGDRFYLELTNSLIEFERDEQGMVVGLVLYEPFSNRGFGLVKTGQEPSQSP